MFILAENAGPRASRHDQAVLPGEVPLELEHISMECHPDRDRGLHSLWSQHLTVALDRRLLEDHLQAPLRVRVARPREVLYRCSPVHTTSRRNQ